MRPPRLGPFDLIGPAGAGAMGEVWRAVHRAQQVPVAIKVVTVDRARAERYRRLFGREVRAVAGLDHGAIVRVFDHGVVPAELSERTHRRLPIGAPWLAMTWLGRGSLRAQRGRLGWPALRQTLLTLLDGLAHAHARGLVHRDFKDANVLLGETGPVITDFGLALDEEDVAGGATGRVVGTPYFMAPEMVRGQIRALGPWTDLYGLGCLAFALATGEPPFAGGAPVEVMHAQSGARRPRVRARFPVPDGFEGWVHRAMAIDRHARFRFAADAAFALMQLGPLAGSLSSTGEQRAVGAEDAAEHTLWAPPAFVAVDEPAWRDEPQRSEPQRVSHPPMPAHWRRPPGPVRPPALSGVGRSLVALREPRLRGRIAERDVLWAALRRVVQGQGCQAVVLSGPSGVGKTRLARWLQYRAHELGIGDMHSATRAPSPEPDCGPIPMFGRALRCRGLAGAGRVEQIRRVLRLPHDQGVAARIGAALDEGGAADERTDRGGEAVRVAAWLEASALMTRQRPAVVLIDDAQWADDALALVLAALRRDAGRTLYLLTVRDDVEPAPGADHLAQIVAHPRTIAVRIGPLGDDAVRRLIDDRLPMDPAAVEMVQRRAAGSPLFAAELVGHWVQSGALVEGPTGFRVRPTARDALPAGFADLWRARLERAVGGAEAWAAEALEGAAVLGIGPAPDEWAAICESAGLVPPAQAIERLLHAHLLIEDGERGWRFGHAMLREALLDRARAAGRLRRWHHLAASALAGAGGDRDRRRALHLQRAGLPEQALPIFVATGWQAWRISEDRRARRAVVDGARAAWRAGLPDSHPTRAELRALWALCARGANVGLRHARRALPALAGADPLTAARIRFAYAYADTGGSDPARTEARFADAVEAAEAAARTDHRGATDATVLAVRGQRWRAALLVRVGEPDAAERCLDAAEASAERLPPALAEVGYLAVRRAEIALVRGRTAEAWALADRARQRFDDLGHRGGLGLVARQLSEIARARGEQLDAERWLRTARDIWRELGRVQAVRLSELNLGLVLSEMGRFDEARGLLYAVRGAGCPAHYDVLACLLLLACDADAGDWAQWRAHWQGIEPLRAGRLVELDVAIAARLAARTAAAAGGEREAADAWQLAVDQFTRLGRAADVASMHAERSTTPTAPLPSSE